MRGLHETSPPQILAFGSGRCRAPRPSRASLGRRLIHTAGAYCRWLWCGPPRHHCACLGQWLSERLGQQFIVENRPGAGGNIAGEAVMKAQPDGYTLLWVGASNTISRSFYAKPNFDIVRDIDAVGSFVRVPLVMLIQSFRCRPKLVSQFVAYAKANPGKLNMGSAGNGSASHVAGELFKLMTGIDMLHIPYRGNPLPDLLGGQVQVYFAATTQSVEVIRAKKVRALGVTATMRSEVLPEISALSEVCSRLRSEHLARHWRSQGSPRLISSVELTRKSTRRSANRKSGAPAR